MSTTLFNPTTVLTVTEEVFLRAKTLLSRIRDVELNTQTGAIRDIRCKQIEFTDGSSFYPYYKDENLEPWNRSLYKIKIDYCYVGRKGFFLLQSIFNNICLTDEELHHILRMKVQH